MPGRTQGNPPLQIPIDPTGQSNPKPAISCMRASRTPESTARYSTTSRGVRETYSIAAALALCTRCGSLLQRALKLQKLDACGPDTNASKSTILRSASKLRSDNGQKSPRFLSNVGPCHLGTHTGDASFPFESGDAVVVLYPRGLASCSFLALP